MSMAATKRHVCCRWGIGLLFLVLTATGLGCGPSKGDITGTVYYVKKPLKIGTVQFTASDGAVMAAQIQPNGSYSVKNLPTGDAKVTELPHPVLVTVPGKKAIVVTVWCPDGQTAMTGGIATYTTHALVVNSYNAGGKIWALRVENTDAAAIKVRPYASCATVG